MSKLDSVLECLFELSLNIYFLKCQQRLTYRDIDIS